MKPFLDIDFLLNSDKAKLLEHHYSKKLPVMDDHSQLSVKQIAEDYCFENLTQAWLHDDPYKYEVMLANGINNNHHSGKNDCEKFEVWPAKVSYTLKNPIYHWTSLTITGRNRITTKQLKTHI